MAAAQLGEHGTHRQLLLIGRVFKCQPRKLVKNALARVTHPGGKKTRRHLVAEPLVYEADDAIHIKVRFAVRLERQKLRLELIIPARRPDEVDGAALLGGIA